MGRLLGIFRRLARRAFAGFGGRRPHREIAFVGSDASMTEQLLRLCTESDRDHARALLVGREVSQEAKSDKKNDTGPAREALYLRPNGKRRRWELHLPRWIDSQQGPEDGQWQTQIDTLVLCLPYDAIHDARAATIDPDYHLAMTIGFARDRGHLRRVAIAICGLPDEVAPRDPSQVSCVIPARRCFDEGVRQLLAVAGDRPGDGFADPVWRTFLAEAVLGSERLAKLVETVRRALRRDCPLFFIPSERGKADPAPVLLDWIDHDVTRYVTRIEAWGRRVAIAAAASLLVVIGLGVVAAPDPRVELAAGLETSGSAIDRRLAGYGWLSRWVLEGDGSAPYLAAVRAQVRQAITQSTEQRSRQERAARLVELRRQLTTWINELDRAVEAQLALLAGADAATRARASEELSRRVTEAATRRSEWLATDEVRAIGAEAALPLDEAISRAALPAALSSLELSGGLGRPVAVLPVAEAMRAALVALSQHDRAVFLDRLTRNSTAKAFYAEYKSHFSRGLFGVGVMERSAVALPRPDAQRILARVRSKRPEDLTAEDRAMVSTLNELARVALPGVVLVEADALQEAAAVRSDGARATQPVEMTIRFFRPFDESLWHVDVAVPGEREVYPAQWIANADRPYAGCYVRVVVKPGATFRVHFNQHARQHVLTQDHDDTDACVSGRGVTTTLSARSGSIQVAGRTIQYEVVSGWPEWSEGGSTVGGAR